MNAKLALNRLFSTLPLHRQFLAFLIVGTGNTLFGYAIFAVLIYIGFHYTMASFLGTAISVVFSFTTMGTLVFKQHHHSLFLRYVLVNICTYTLSIAFIYLGTYFSTNLYLLGALSLMPAAGFTYFFNKYYVFQMEPI